ncbi:MAG: hypothetical protein J6Y86_10715 [Pseudobutyrivibrio sp.]|nr:hypothetical protein [Pseudobutyrivibrio sp.]
MIATNYNGESPIALAQDILIRANLRINACQQTKNNFQNVNANNTDIINWYDSEIYRLNVLKKSSETIIKKYQDMETISEPDLINPSQQYYEDQLRKDGSLDNLKVISNFIPQDNNDIVAMMAQYNQNVINNHGEQANRVEKNFRFADENGGALATKVVFNDYEETVATRKFNLTEKDEHAARKAAYWTNVDRRTDQDPKIIEYNKNLGFISNQYHKLQEEYQYAQANHASPETLNKQAVQIEYARQCLDYFHNNPPAKIDEAYLNSRRNELYTQSYFNQPSERRPSRQNNNEPSSSNSYHLRTTSSH